MRRRFHQNIKCSPLSNVSEEGIVVIVQNGQSLDGPLLALDRAASELWNGSGAFVFTSSSGVYPDTDSSTLFTEVGHSGMNGVFSIL